MEKDSMSLEDLEKSISSQPKKEETPTMKAEEEIAFHKGSLNTLVNERNELLKMISNVEKIIGVHISRLNELGVEIK